MGRRALTASMATATAAVLLGGCGLSLQSLPKISGSIGSTYPLHAVFSNVLNLPADAQVRTGAEVVGQVGSISTTNFQAQVTLNIKKDVTVVQGTTAQVRFDNPLGDEYVLLQAPTDATGEAPLKAGSLIPVSDTSTAPSVEDTLGALSLVLNGGGINQLQTIIQQLNYTFQKSNQPQIHQLLSTINTAVTTLANGKTPVDNALTALSNLTSTLNGKGGASAQTIGSGIAAIAPAITLLAQENSSIDSLLQNLSDLGSVGTQIAETAGRDSVNDVKDLLPVVNQLNSVSSQLGGDLTDLSAFEAETPKVAPGDYLQVSVIANVILPSGDYSPSPGTTAAPNSTATTSSGGAAVNQLLEAGAL